MNDGTEVTFALMGLTMDAPIDPTNSICCQRLAKVFMMNLQ